MGLSVSQRRITRLSLSCSQFLLSELQSVSLGDLVPCLACVLETFPMPETQLFQTLL